MSEPHTFDCECPTCEGAFKARRDAGKPVCATLDCAARVQVVLVYDELQPGTHGIHLAYACTAPHFAPVLYATRHLGDKRTIHLLLFPNYDE